MTNGQHIVPLSACAGHVIKADACAPRGFCLQLFEALDSADIVAIDGVELMPRYRELAPSRRLVRLANDEGLTIEDQEVRIADGATTFVDLDGHPHQARFSVERVLEESDLPG